MRTTNQLILLFLVFANVSFAQNYQGKIVNDKNTGIEFAHVFFLNDQARGSISNENGDFNITVSEANKKDTLVISVLGYKTKFISYAAIDDYNNVIQLSTSEIKLDEIIVYSDTYFRYILKEAIAKIPDNYLVEEHLQKGYYQNYTISDSTYSEMIEADIQLISNGYDKANIKETLYLNQLRKTEDNRNLPERLKGTNNEIYNTLRCNSISKRKLRNFEVSQKLKSINEFVQYVDKFKTLQFHSQSIQENDTILTIKILSSFLKMVDLDGHRIHEDAIYTLVSINLSDKAIVKVLHGNIWTDKKDFQEVSYRKIKGKYYPTYLRTVTSFEFDNKTKSHYSARNLIFYEVMNQHEMKGFKKGKKMSIEKDLRNLKMKLDNKFWEKYPHANELSATLRNLSFKKK